MLLNILTNEFIGRKEPLCSLFQPMLIGSVDASNLWLSTPKTSPLSVHNSLRPFTLSKPRD